MIGFKLIASLLNWCRFAKFTPIPAVQEAGRGLRRRVSKIRHFRRSLSASSRLNESQPCRRIWVSNGDEDGRLQTKRSGRETCSASARILASTCSRTSPKNGLLKKMTLASGGKG